MAVKRQGRLEGGLRVRLESYLQETGAKVYSLVVAVPFSPLDIDLRHLARGEWNALVERFRVWYLPKEDGSPGESVCYVTIRKFDPQDGVLLYGHVVVNFEARSEDEPVRNFTVGIMCNDEVRARSMLNSMLEIPPSFHRRSEVRLIERRWRNDPEAVMRYLANIHSVIAQATPSGKVYALKFEPPPEIMGGAEAEPRRLVVGSTFIQVVPAPNFFRPRLIIRPRRACRKAALACSLLRLRPRMSGKR